MDSEELTDWLAYEQEYGLADGYYLVGKLAPILAAAFGGKARTAADFVSYFRQAPKPRRRQSTREMRDRFRVISDLQKPIKGRV